MKGIIVLFIIICSCVVFNAQGQAIIKATDTAVKAPAPVIYQKPKGPKAIKHELSVGGRLNTDGWSAFTDIGKVMAADAKHSDMFYNVRFWQIELTGKKNPREEKITSDNSNPSGGSSNYVYGKINSFYALKLGYGFRKRLAGKPDPGTVSIHWVNVGGASLGMLKPYYLDVATSSIPIKYSPSNSSAFLSQDNIEGAAGFSKGLSELAFIPGIYYRSALHFDFSTNRKNVIAAEAGVNIEYYFQSIALMANQSSTNYFADLFIALQFGKRW